MDWDYSQNDMITRELTGYQVNVACNKNAEIKENGILFIQFSYAIDLFYICWSVVCYWCNSMINSVGKWCLLIEKRVSLNNDTFTEGSI